MVDAENLATKASTFSFKRDLQPLGCVTYSSSWRGRRSTRGARASTEQQATGVATAETGAR